MARSCNDSAETGNGLPLRMHCILQHNAIANCLTVILGARHTVLRLIAENLLRVHAFVNRDAFLYCGYYVLCVATTNITDNS